MRDRLIELLGDYLYSEQIADHLLKNGVIVPPCKVGDVVYMPIITDDTHEPAIWDITITQISIETGKLLASDERIISVSKSNKREVQKIMFGGVIQ